MKPSNPRNIRRRAVNESDISPVGSAKNATSAFSSTASQSVRESTTAHDTPRAARRRQAVRITLTSSRSDKIDEKAEVRIFLDDAQDVVNKMLTTLSNRFPPESVMTITHGANSLSDETSSSLSSSVNEPEYSHRPVLMSKLAEVADMNALPNLDSLPDEHLSTLSTVDASLLPSILQLDVNKMARFLEDPELLEAASSLAHVNANLVKLLTTISAPDIKKLSHLPQYLVQFVLSLDTAAISRLAADSELLGILSKQTDDDIFELIMSLSENRLQTLFRSPETLKRLLSMPSFVINTFAQLNNKTFNNVISDERMLERLAAFEESALLCHLGLLEDDDQMRALANDDSTLTKILRDLGEGKGLSKSFGVTKKSSASSHKTDRMFSKNSGTRKPTVEALPVRYVEVEVVTEVETLVPKKTVVVKERNVSVVNTVYVEKLVEVPEIHFVDKIVEVEEIQYVDKPVVKTITKYDDVVVTRKVPVVKKVLVERTVDVPGEVVEFPVYYQVQKNVIVPQFVDRQVPTVVAQLLQPLLVEGRSVEEVECVTIDPVLIPVDVFIPKLFKTNLESQGHVQVTHMPVTIPSAHYNSLVLKSNPHLDDEQMANLFEKSVDGSVPILPTSEFVDIIPPKTHDWAEHVHAGHGYAV